MGKPPLAEPGFPLVVLRHTSNDKIPLAAKGGTSNVLGNHCWKLEIHVGNCGSTVKLLLFNEALYCFKYIHDNKMNAWK